MPSFNLVDELWIPCISTSGQYQTHSLRKVFERAGEIQEIVHSSPLVTAAVHRLLLAILHKNFGPGSLHEWQRLWSARRWETVDLNAYLDGWRHRLDLFDTHRPFYQVPHMEDAQINPITTLAQESASGNNATLFDHGSDDFPISMTPAEAVCYVIGRQAYSIGFGKSNPFYLSDSTLVRGLTVRVIGNDLFETLMLNLVRYNRNVPIPHTGEDVPAWEREGLPKPDREGTVPTGYLDYLTWQSRRIHLIPDGDPPSVRWCQVQQSLKLRGDPLDPFKSYRKDEKRGLVPVGLNPSKAVWRDSHTLLQDAEAAAAVSFRPGVFDWAARINGLRAQGDSSIRSEYRFEAVGIATDSGKAASVLFWRHERLPLPLPYLEERLLVERLKEALEVADKVQRDLNSVVWAMAVNILAPGDGRSPDTKAVRDLVDHLGADRAYWSRLEAPFKRLMVALPQDRNEHGEYGDRQLPAWKDALRATLRDAFAEATLGLERSTRTLRALAIAERSLAARTSKYLRTDQEGGDDDTGVRTEPEGP